MSRDFEPYGSLQTQANMEVEIAPNRYCGSPFSFSDIIIIVKGPFSLHNNTQ